MSDAKAIDAQYGMEKGLTSLAAALAGGNLIYESLGHDRLASGGELRRRSSWMTKCTPPPTGHCAGVEVSEENLGFDAICEAVLGDGHFLGGAQTMAAMERDYVYPDIADRDTPRAWADKGAPDAWSMARNKARAILAEHHPAYLSTAQDAEIRKTFKILS